LKTLYQILQLGTGFEYKQDLFFTPLIVFEAEDLTTNSTASAALKKTRW
jgi:hypothetical protein